MVKPLAWLVWTWQRGRYNLHREWATMEDAARQRWAKAQHECDLPGPQPYEPWIKWARRRLKEWL